MLILLVNAKGRDHPGLDHACRSFSSVKSNLKVDLLVILKMSSSIRLTLWEPGVAHPKEELAAKV